MRNLKPLQPGRYYHIYNRGNNREDLFRTSQNYRYFLELYARYVNPIADTFVYCLMRNHFHLLMRIKTEAEWRETYAKISNVAGDLVTHPFNPSRSFSHLFNAYAQSINKMFKRTGSLFQERFRRIEVTTGTYFTNLVFYIHFNPQKHGFVDDFREWPWSSYGALLSNAKTQLQRRDVMTWFNGVQRLQEFHRGAVDEKLIAHLIEDDWE